MRDDSLSILGAIGIAIVAIVISAYFWQPKTTAGVPVSTTETSIDIVDPKVIVIDSCEYISYQGYMSRHITHKGNCKFCKERELEQLKILQEKYKNEKN